MKRLAVAMILSSCAGPIGGEVPDGGDASSDVITTSDASDAGAIGDGAANPMGLSCATTNTSLAPNPCPTPSGASGKASFCFRAQWAGVTSVDVIGGFGQTGDWKTAFVTLTNDGAGTFTGAASLASGSYAYVFRVSGSTDNLFHDPTYLLDQEATEFTPAPPQSPIGRSLPVVTVPQSTTPPTLHHLRGKVVYDGQPQPCFSVAIDVGEMYKDGGGGVLSEQSTANFAESDPDGTFDFPIASGPVTAIVRYPFLLSGADAGYPAVPSQVAAIGFARTGTNLASGDVSLDPVEVSYPAADYGKLSPTPTGGTVPLPVTFDYSIVPGSSAANVAVIATNIAGNDPAYWSAYGTATSQVFDGGLGGTLGPVVPGQKYWWGTWQKRAESDAATTWSEESLLFPIVFQ